MTVTVTDGAARHARVPYAACPLCDGAQRTLAREVHCDRHPVNHPLLPPTIRWLRCDECGHVFADGYFAPDALALLLEARHPSDQQPGGEVEAQRRIAGAIVARVTASRGGLAAGRWLDVGFGNGALLATADEFGYHAVGLDLRVDVVAAMEAQGFEVHRADLEAYAAPPASFSVVSLADVLEHVPFPRRALARARELVADDGRLFVSMPNLDSLAFRLLDADGAHPYWWELEHLHNFGRRRLYELLEELGFEPVGYSVSRRYVACMEVIARPRR